MTVADAPDVEAGYVEDGLIAGDDNPSVSSLRRLATTYLRRVSVAHWHSARSLKRLSAGPGFNPQTRQDKLSQDYWRACFEINFSDRQEGLTVSSIIRDR